MKEQFKERWNLLTRGQFAGFCLGMLGFVALVMYSEPGFVLFLDHANLLFHEAGHPFVGIFSSHLETYGGTMGQLAFPIVLAISFWRQRESVSFAASLIWLFENGLNIARYMADARQQILPLVGGGDHDWARIFGRWGVTAYDTQIANVVRIISWSGMALATGWIIWLWFVTAKERKTEIISEEDRRIKNMLQGL